ncbi:uncharacterized protein LOC114928759 [Nylanderia fulva]|uniref:uncharacterized protein LOC114928759 n=1 Tax=Nylanderia fulva TaxID=613905 RepID=UPI0010FB5DA8|nr:uncharacterized protein LOC114928759 [Nylanderia fulva]
MATCVRRQGESFVDLTWVTPSASRLVSGWRVLAEIETISDHRYVEFSVGAFPREVIERRRNREAVSQRWALRKLDQDAFLAAVEAALMVRGEESRGDQEGERAWLHKTIINACDAAMPRIKRRSP